MSDFEELFKGDMARYGDEGIRGWTRRWLYYFRKASTCKNKIMSRCYNFAFRVASRERGIEIPCSINIGKGLYIGHPYNIAIHPGTKIGNNFNVHKGVTIGQENRGKRKGVPTIGNQVYVGINVTMVGKITIGDDVLIAPNSFVNCDIPSHSIAIGNPCKIIPRENATENYINNQV